MRSRASPPGTTAAQPSTAARGSSDARLADRARQRPGHLVVARPGSLGPPRGRVAAAGDAAARLRLERGAVAIPVTGRLLLAKGRADRRLRRPHEPRSDHAGRRRPAGLPPRRLSEPAQPHWSIGSWGLLGGRCPSSGMPRILSRRNGTPFRSGIRRASGLTGGPESVARIVQLARSSPAWGSEADPGPGEVEPK